MDFNTNMIFTGGAMLMLNLGAKYIHADLGKFHEQILSNEYVKKIIIFCMFFVATRNISIAFLLTIFYIIIIDGVLHEKRRFCLIPKKYINNSTVSSVEYNKALEIIEKYNKDNAVREVGSDNKDNYINYLSLIK
jgi:hypothetical protein